MTAKHQRTLLVAGTAVIVCSLAMAVIRAMWLLEFDGKFDFWPFVSCGGLVFVVIAVVAKMKDKATASLVAFVLRLFNTGFAFFAAAATFMWLPINNRVGADLFSAALVDGTLLVVAVAYWWFVHRELRLALKKEDA